MCQIHDYTRVDGLWDRHREFEILCLLASLMLRLLELCLRLGVLFGTLHCDLLSQQVVLNSSAGFTFHLSDFLKHHVR